MQNTSSTSAHRQSQASRGLTVSLSQGLADKLWHAESATFLTEQRDRFEGDPTLPDPDDVVFATGCMRWFRTAADAVLLLAFEQAAGHHVTMLWDLALEEHVILSTRGQEPVTS